MNELFLLRVLMAAISEMATPEMVIYNRFFKGKEKFQPSSLLKIDVISGSEKLVQNIKVSDPCTVTKKTGRRQISIEAPRLAPARFIAQADILDLMKFGETAAVELMKERIAREQKDMLNEVDRTIEYWASCALRGLILDTDGTVLVDYNLPAEHKPVLAGGALWTDAASNPIAKIREWKRVIEDDHKGYISGFKATVGAAVMDALLDHPAVVALLKGDKGTQMAEDGKISRLCGVEIEEYAGSFLDGADVRQRFIPDNVFSLVGEGPDTFGCPYAPIVDSDAPGSLGNTVSGKPVPTFSNSWTEKNPDGRWLKVETRRIPVLQRIGAVIWAEPVL